MAIGPVVTRGYAIGTIALVVLRGFGAAASTGPTVTSVVPSSGPQSGGKSVTVTGVGFTGATSVTFDGLSVSFLSVLSDTALTCQPPNHGPATVNVAVTTPSGTGTGNNLYTYVDGATGGGSISGGTFSRGRWRKLQEELAAARASKAAGEQLAVDSPAAKLVAKLEQRQRERAAEDREFRESLRRKANAVSRPDDLAKAFKLSAAITKQMEERKAQQLAAEAARLLEEDDEDAIALLLSV